MKFGSCVDILQELANETLSRGSQCVVRWCVFLQSEQARSAFVQTSIDASLSDVCLHCSWSANTSALPSEWSSILSTSHAKFSRKLQKHARRRARVKNYGMCLVSMVDPDAIHGSYQHERKFTNNCFIIKSW